MTAVPETLARAAGDREGAALDWLAGSVSLDDIADRYGNPLNAAYSADGLVLYDGGGWLPPGFSTVLNASGRPEPVRCPPASGTG